MQDFAQKKTSTQTMSQEQESLLPKTKNKSKNQKQEPTSESQAKAISKKQQTEAKQLALNPITIPITLMLKTLPVFRPPLRTAQHWCLPGAFECSSEPLHNTGRACWAQAIKLDLLPIQRFGFALLGSPRFLTSTSSSTMGPCQHALPRDLV